MKILLLVCDDCKYHRDEYFIYFIRRFYSKYWFSIVFMLEVRIRRVFSSQNTENNLRRSYSPILTYGALVCIEIIWKDINIVKI